MLGQFPKRVIDRRPAPTEKTVPEGTGVSKMDTTAWIHNTCRRPVDLYADYSAWCPFCKVNVQLEQRTEIRARGRYYRRPRK